MAGWLASLFRRAPGEQSDPPDPGKVEVLAEDQPTESQSTDSQPTDSQPTEDHGVEAADQSDDSESVARPVSEPPRRAEPAPGEELTQDRLDRALARLRSEIPEPEIQTGSDDI